MLTSLVAGGAGFLGSHTCERLLAEGHTVLCVDNLLTGSKGNIAHLLSQSRFSFVKHDVTRPLEVDIPLDYVLHLASPASPKDYLRYPIETMQAGAWGTFNLLELARREKAVFLLASTSEVYGDPAVHPQPEDYWGHVNPIGVRSVYDEAKRYAEALTAAYRRKYALETRIARIFNTYGPRMQPEDGRALPNFMMQALRGAPLTVYGDGSQTRSFCYVSDMVDGLFKLLCSNENDPTNLGNPEEVTLLRLAREVIDLTRSSSQLVFQPLPQDDPRTRRPDIAKARRILAWEPRVSRAEGLRLTLPYFQSVAAGT